MDQKNKIIEENINLKDENRALKEIIDSLKKIIKDEGEKIKR
jgi:regulator of replication initiation timing